MTLNLPHGSYFVIPSLFGPSIDQVALLEAIRQNVDLSSSGIPRLDIAAGEQKTMTLDLVAAQQALYKLLPYVANP